MSRGVFQSQNKVLTYWDFQTNASSATTFTPIMSSGSKRVSWDLGDGFYYAGSNLSYVFSGGSSTKNGRTISRYNGNKIVTTLNFSNDKLVGLLNLSGFTNVTYLQYDNNPSLHTVIMPDSNVLSFVIGTGNPTVPQNINGTLDISRLTGLTTFSIAHSPKITGILNPTTTSSLSNYSFNNNGSYPVTGITGTLNMTGLTNQRGTFMGQSNPNLTKVLSPITNGVFTYYNLVACGLIGEHDISGLNNLGGDFIMNNNGNLTAVTHCYSPQIFTSYSLSSCNITGQHNLSMIPNLGNSFSIHYNPNLTSIIHTASTIPLGSYRVNNCNITGTHDISMLYGLYGVIAAESNINMTSVLLPKITGGTFTNGFLDNCLRFRSCDLGYIDFKVLSAATLNTNSTYGATIELYNNSMTTTEVNHILTDFDWISTVNLNGWSGVTLSILGGNSSPDSSSGGYDGIAAINSLTGSPKNWIIT
jgi:hypothetical protein